MTPRRDVERRLTIVQLLARRLVDQRGHLRIEHEIVEMLRFRVFAIVAGHEDADDGDNLRAGPAFRLEAGRLPASIALNISSWRPLQGWRNVMPSSW